MPINRDEIEVTVFEIVRGILADPQRRLSFTDDLVRDLRIQSDDLTFLLVPQVEREFEIRVPIEDWDKVYTVGDVIALVERHIGTSPSP